MGTTDWALPTSSTTGTRRGPMVLKMSLPSWPGTAVSHTCLSILQYSQGNHPFLQTPPSRINHIQLLSPPRFSSPYHPFQKNSPVLNGKFGTSLYSHSHFSSPLLITSANPPNPLPHTTATLGSAKCAGNLSRKCSTVSMQRWKMEAVISWWASWKEWWRCVALW